MSRLLAYSLFLGVYLAAALIIVWIARFFVGPHALPQTLRRRVVLALLAVLAVVGSIEPPLVGRLRPIHVVVLAVLWLWLLSRAYGEWRRAAVNRY